MIMRRPIVIANHVRLSRGHREGTIILVEGRDDRLFLSKFINNQLSKIIVVENKENVMETITILEGENFPGVLGLVDADFDNVTSPPQKRANIVSTSVHDLECVLLRSRCLEAVIAEFGSEDKLNQFDGDVRKRLLQAAKPIGNLRLHSHREGLGLRFDNIRYSRIILRESLETDLDMLADEVRKQSNRLDISRGELIEGVRAVEELAYDPWQICVGTDM